MVVAFDFDDTVYDYHKKERIYNNVVALLHDLKSINCYLICWTGNADTELVTNYLVDNNIPFDAINEDPSFINSTNRKIYTNVFIDDRAGLIQVYNELLRLVAEVKKKA